MAPAAVGLATGVVAMTALVVLAGSLLPVHGVAGTLLKAMHAHPSGGLVALLFGMGVPVHWKAAPLPLQGTVGGMSVVAKFPALLLATAVVAAAAIVAGLLAARARDRAGRRGGHGLVAPIVSFGVLTATVAWAVSHARPMRLAPGLRADVNVSPFAALLFGAAWAAAGIGVGLAIHEQLARRLSGRLVQAARTPVASGLVVLSFGLATLGCAGPPASTLGASPRSGGAHHSGDASTTTTTGALATTSTSALAPESPTTTAASRGAASGSRAAGAASGGSAGATAATAGLATGGAAAGTTSGGSGGVAGAGLQPPAPGTYSYDTTGTLSYLGTTKPYPAVTSLVVDPVAGTVQHALRELRNGGDGFVIEQTYDYRPEGIAVDQQRLTVTLGAIKTVKTLYPTAAALWFGTNDRPGAHHEFDLQGKDISAHETVDLLRVERITVGGQSVDAHVVRTTLTFAGSASGRITLDQWFVRSARVVGKEHLDGDVKASIVRLTTSYDATLQRLTPS